MNEGTLYLLILGALALSLLAQALYLDPGYFSKIIQGKMPLNSRLQLLIENTFKVNGDWLRTGEGDIFLVPADSSIKSRVLDEIDKLNESQLALVDSFIRQYFKLDQKE